MDKKIFLTVPSEIVNAVGDNSENDLVIAKGDYLSNSENNKYMVIDLLGTGTFGQVVRCIGSRGEEVAIKVVKNQAKYYHYEMNEVKILQRLLYSKVRDRFVQIHDVFIYKQHLCIVEELLGHNLYTVLKITRFKGLDHSVLRSILWQILEGLSELALLGITHCDLKPENILMSDYENFKVKIIDFGSSMVTTQGSYFYVQSRYYRAPEVILGLPYSSSCDVWSFGCIAYELLIGRPLFQGRNNTDQIARIHRFFGSLPTFMLEHGSNSHMYFDKENNYRPLTATPEFNVHDFKKAINQRAGGSSSENEDFITFLLDALQPSHLIRPDARTLMRHPYFRPLFHVDEPVKEPSCTSRDLHAPLPRTFKQRHNSTTGVVLNGKKHKIANESRKTSVYNLSYENKSNTSQDNNNL